MKMITWGWCPDCGQLVRTRADNGLMWGHFVPERVAAAGFGSKFHVGNRCHKSGATPMVTVEIESGGWLRDRPAFRPRGAAWELVSAALRENELSRDEALRVAAVWKSLDPAEREALLCG